MKSILVLLIGDIKYDGRVQKEIYTLQKAGHHVTLVVSSFNTNDNLDNYDFDIIELRSEYSSFAIGRLFSAISYYRQIHKIIKTVSPNIIHCNDLNTLLYIGGISRSIEVVYDAHELYLEGRTGLIKWFWDKVEKTLIYRTKAVIVPQIDRLYYMSFRYKLPIYHYHLVENFPMKTNNLTRTYFKDVFGLDTGNRTVISYIGAITKERELLPLIESMTLIDNAVLFIIGKGNKEYELQLNNFIEKNKLQDIVKIYPPIPHNEVLYAINSSHIGVCFYNDKNFNSYFCASNKLYEYLDLGVKVLTNYTAGVAHVVHNGENGYCCRIINKENIAEGLKVLLNMQSIVRANYYWENQVNTFLKIYE